jgi:hypothetical protein
MLDYDEPVKDYQSYFKELHERNTSEFFEDLVRQSKVDEQLNINTIQELRALEENVHKQSQTRGWWKFARVSMIVIASLSGLLMFTGAWFFILTLIGSLLFLFLKVNKRVKDQNLKVEALSKQVEEKANEAWDQMSSLNKLFDWGIAKALFEKTMPIIQFDNFMSSSRLGDLQKNFGLTPEFNQGRSVLTTQSGLVNENPFAVVKFLEHWMGSKTYTGSIVIYWTEQVRNAQGNWITVQKSQTLVATVTKPFPEYHYRNMLVFGHEAAPNLSFSRTPSNLSGMEEGVINNWKKGHAIKKIEKKARTQLKKGTGDLTLMSNKEFEALFNATNRDNEIEFRLLFTPLAQQEMVNIMNDKNVGFGDNFSFSKYGPLNIVEPSHLQGLKFDSDPSVFYSNDIKQARANFNDYNNLFFKSMFFTFAPLFSVPLYREKRSIAFPKAGSEHGVTSHWEHEAMANFMGQGMFKHPNSVTENILQTTEVSREGDHSIVNVTAYGYQGFPMVDYVPKLGGDGAWHQVPVHWTHYEGVKHESSIAVGHIVEADEDAAKKKKSSWSQLLNRYGSTEQNAVVRGLLAGAILNRK